MDEEGSYPTIPVPKQTSKYKCWHALHHARACTVSHNTHDLWLHLSRAYMYIQEAIIP